MAKPQPPKTFHIFYAWAEGPWFGKKLSTELIRAGFKEAPISEATVLIAHSIGTYFVRPNENNKIKIFVGPPLWPNKSMLVRVFRKSSMDRQNISFTNWLYKLFWNNLYIVTKPRVTLRAARSIHLENPLIAAGNNALVIQNNDDVFCSPDLRNLISQSVISLPGQHDDCWHNPMPYIKIIESEYKSLANM